MYLTNGIAAARALSAWIQTLVQHTFVLLVAVFIRFTIIRFTIAHQHTYRTEYHEGDALLRQTHRG